MRIGDWEINILDKHEFRTVPGDNNSTLQRVFHYEFHHIPTNFSMPQTIHFIQYRNDDDIADFLKEHSKQLERVFVTPLSN